MKNNKYLKLIITFLIIGVMMSLVLNSKTYAYENDTEDNSNHILSVEKKDENKSEDDNESEENDESEEAIVIEFKDKNLYNEIVKALGNKIIEKSNNKIKISAEDLKSVTNLKLSQKEIVDISGIEKFTSLTELDLSGNKIVDIKPLKDLKNLTVLYLQINEINDISAIKDFEKLIYLSVGGNKLDIKDLDVIKEMIENGNMDNLQGLWLFGLGISKIDEIDYILELKDHLTCLDIHSNKFSDVSFLSEFKKLNTLYLFDNNIADLSALKEMKSLITYNPANQHVELSQAKTTEEIPTILKQAFKDFGTTKVKTTNCKLNSDKTKLTIEDTSKDAIITISDGKLVGTTITIKYDKKASANKTSDFDIWKIILAIIVIIIGAGASVFTKKFLKKSTN